MILLKIAFRNIVYSRRRSLLIGLALFICTFSLLFSNAAINGIETQVISGYVNYQSGHVAVLWSDMKDVSTTDPSRFLDNLKSFNPETAAENLAAVARLEQYLADAEIEHGSAGIVRLGTYAVGDDLDKFIIYGLTEQHADFLQQAGTLDITAGELSHSGIVISRYLAEQNNLDCGDMLTIRVTTPTGQVNEKEYPITGIYANGAGYENSFAFMHQQEARLLTGVEAPLFDIYRIYLADHREAEEFALKLDSYLLEENAVLRAENFREASPFSPTIPT